MRVLLAGAILLMGIGTATSFASHIVITPASQIGLNPGQTVGWDFSLTPDTTDYMEIQTVTLDESPSLGTYTDFLELYTPFGPGTSDVFFAYDPSTDSGVGSYAIDPGTVLSALTTLGFEITYNLYPCDRSLGGSCAADQTGLTLYDDLGNTPQVTLQIADSTPEPSTIWLCGGAAVLLGWLRRPRHGVSP